MTDIEQAILHHLTREFRPCHRELVRDELVRIARVNAELPRASVAEWDQAIDSLIADGEILAAGERIAVVRKAVEPAKSDMQGMLF